MKKFDIKKIGIILAIVLVVVLGIFLIGKAIKGGSVNETDLKKYEEYVENYYMNLTAGYNTAYKGLEVLYANDETTLEEVTEKQLITSSIEYITKTGISSSIDYATIRMVYKDKYPEINNSMLYSAEDIRKGIEVLYGIKNFANPSIPGNITSLSEYTYIAEEDIYMISLGDTTLSVASKSQSMDYSIIKTEGKKDKIVTTVAIAYRNMTGANFVYASDRLGENIVAKDVKEFPKDKIDEFDKFEFTLKKSEDGKSYVFESVKKVK